ncbi:MAG: glycosyltransferase [Acidimicrobiales bacterium]|jgi:cellulose synthase/poly-beta-1,6-N-acetylglucosamine synthase-like glycosyltransferase
MGGPPVKTVVLLTAGVLCLVTGFVLRSGAQSLPRTIRTGRVARRWRTERDRARFSTDGLFVAMPELSARNTLSTRQRDAFIAGGVALLISVVIAPHLTVVFIVSVCTLGYAASMVVRLWLYVASLGGPELVRLSDTEARSAPDEVLRTYTVLVPVFREPEVMSSLVANLRRLDYPADRLQILLLVETDDSATITSARWAIGPANDIRILLVPPGGPRTKPKALNYGLTHVTGTYITIFDAEDRPDPLQLRKAALAFSTQPASVACLQARLGFFNGRQNLITRWFQVEYSMWFRQMLPGLSKLGAPIPLGGTSNHFRTDVLLDLGAWDPNNVTEDADLGARLSRAGYRSEVLDSVTLEEANSDFVNWAKQRSRWYKGYLQTFLVHIRDIRSTRRAMGTRELLFFTFLVGGTPLMAMANPVFWILTVLWFSVKPAWIMTMYPAPVYYVGLVVWLAGNFLFTFISMLEAVEVDDSLFVAALLTPLYWVMMSVAAFKALIQVVFAPTYWEKTRHGLAGPARVAATPVRPAS